MSCASISNASGRYPTLPVRVHAPGTGQLIELVGNRHASVVDEIPVLRRVDHAVATGAVVFRTIEAVMYLVGVVAALSLLPLSEPASASGERTVTIAVMVDALTTVRHRAGLVAVFASPQAP